MASIRTWTQGNGIEIDEVEFYELCIIGGMTPPEAIILVLRDRYALSNSTAAKKLSEVLKRDISPQAAANFYRKARAKAIARSRGGAEA